MGASESKLVFKQGIFRLSEEKDIPPDDPYWARVCSESWIIYDGVRSVANGCDVVLGAPGVDRGCLQFIYPRRHTANP